MTVIDSYDNDGDVSKVTILMTMLTSIIPNIIEYNGNDQFGFLSSVS